MSTISPTKTSAVIAAFGLSRSTGELTTDQLKGTLETAAKDRVAKYADENQSGARKAAATRKVKMIIDTLEKRGESIDRSKYLPAEKVDVTSMSKDELYQALVGAITLRGSLESSTDGGSKSAATREVKKFSAALDAMGDALDVQTAEVQKRMKAPANSSK